MIKVFTKNKNSKIELTEKEIKELLDEAYWEGYRDNNHWTYTSPSITSNDWWKNQPYYTTTSTDKNITINSSLN